MKNWRNRLLPKACLAATAFFFSNGASASILITSTTINENGTHGGTTIQEETGPREYHATDLGVSSDAYVNTGILRAASYAASNSATYGTVLGSRVHASISDTFRITGGSGQGVLTFRVTSHDPAPRSKCYSESSHNASFVQSLVGVMIGGQTAAAVGHTTQDDCFGSPLNGIDSKTSSTMINNPYSGEAYNLDRWDESVTLSVLFSFGSEITLLMSLDTIAELYWGGAGEAKADAYHTTFWDGIVSVTDTDGNQITDYSVSSDSGANYRTSFAPATSQVPEPGSLVLVGLAMLGMTLLRRNGKPSTGY